jgi:hypothetical protein
MIKCGATSEIFLPISHYLLSLMPWLANPITGVKAVRGSLFFTRSGFLDPAPPEGQWH